MTKKIIQESNFRLNFRLYKTLISIKKKKIKEKPSLTTPKKKCITI